MSRPRVGMLVDGHEHSAWARDVIGQHRRRARLAGVPDDEAVVAVLRTGAPQGACDRCHRDVADDGGQPFLVLLSHGVTSVSALLCQRCASLEGVPHA